MEQQGVTHREDSWVEVAAERPDGFTDGPLQLRCGGDESKIRIKSAGASEQEVGIHDLLDGIGLIQKEHDR